MWEFKGIDIEYKSSGYDDLSVCNSIEKYPDKVIYWYGIDNPSLQNVDNRNKDIRVFFLYFRTSNSTKLMVNWTTTFFSKKPTF